MLGLLGKRNDKIRATKLALMRRTLSHSALIIVVPIMLILTTIPSILSTNSPKQILVGQNRPPIFEQFVDGINLPADFVANTDRMAAIAMIRTKCRHCSISDPDAEQCWNDTLSFFEQTILKMMRGTIMAETNRILWMIHRNEQPRQMDYGRLVNESFWRFMHLPRAQHIKDDNDWANSPHLVFEHLSPAIMDSVRPLLRKMLHYYNGQNPNPNQQNGRMAMPNLLRNDCPNACERSWDSWKWLFVASLLLSLCLFGVLSLFVFLLDRQEQCVWRMECTEFAENASVVLALNGQKATDERKTMKRAPNN